MKTALLALSALSIGVSAQAATIKQIKTPSSLKTVHEKCERHRKNYEREIREKLECPTFAVYQMPKDFDGMSAEEVIYNELGGSMFDSNADKAFNLINGSFRDQFLDAIPEIEDGIEETMNYYQETMDSIESILFNARKGRHNIWHNDPLDHDGLEATAIIYDKTRGIVITITHSRVAG